jgi:hypothetical protein
MREKLVRLDKSGANVAINALKKRRTSKNWKPLKK